MLEVPRDRYRDDFPRFLVDAALTLVLVVMLVGLFNELGWFGDSADVVAAVPVVMVALYQLWFG